MKPTKYKSEFKGNLNASMDSQLQQFGVEPSVHGVRRLQRAFSGYATQKRAFARPLNTINASRMACPQFSRICAKIKTTTSKRLKMYLRLRSKCLSNFVSL